VLKRYRVVSCSVVPDLAGGSSHRSDNAKIVFFLVARYATRCYHSCTLAQFQKAFSAFLKLNILKLNVKRKTGNDFAPRLNYYLGIACYVFLYLGILLKKLSPAL